MNDENKSPDLQTWIDPELEARVVAWVLGEASEFEAAELTRIISEKPELGIFKRRIEAVHGLVAAASRMELDPMRLAEERRGKLMETLGRKEPFSPPPVVAIPMPKEQAGGGWRISWRMIGGIAACLLVLALLASISMPAFTGVQVRSAATKKLAEEKMAAMAGAGKETPEALPSNGMPSSFSNTGQGQNYLAAAPHFMRQVQVGSASQNFAMPPAQTPPRLAALDSLKALARSQGDEEDKSASDAFGTSGEEMKDATRAPVAQSGPARLAQELAARNATIVDLKKYPDSPNAGIAIADLKKDSSEDIAQDSQQAVQDRSQMITQQAQHQQQGQQQLLEQAQNAVTAPVAAPQFAARQFAQVQDNNRDEQSHRTATRDLSWTGNASKSASGLDSGAIVERARARALAARGPVDSLQALPSGMVGGGSQQLQQQTFALADAQSSSGAMGGAAAAQAAPVAGQVQQQQAEEATDSATSIPAAPAVAQAQQVQAMASLATANTQVHAALDQAQARMPSQQAGQYMADAAQEKAEPAAAAAAGSASASVATQMPPPPPTASTYRVFDAASQTFSGNIAYGSKIQAQQAAQSLASLDDASKSVDATNAATENPASPPTATVYKGGRAATLTFAGGAVKQQMVVLNGDTPVIGHLFHAMKQADAARVVIPTQEEVSATDQPYSTFSLHVSDVSFLLARTALANGEMPDPESIRPEEFYNAFDYGDPAPVAGEKIACRIEQAVHPVLQQRNLVRIAMKVAATGRGQGQPLRLTVLLDTSGSMERADRAASVRKAMEVLTSLLGPNDAVTLIGFARQPRLLAEEVPGDQAGKLADIAAHTPAEGGTNMEEAIKLASQLALRHLQAGAQNRVVMLTDGAANLGDADPAQLSKLVERLRQQGVSFDACGVGADGLNDDILEALTRKGGGRYYFLNQPEDAGDSFARQLAGAFRPAAENVKMQVRFNPARVGKYQLIGFEKHRLNQEDFRNDKVTAAQLAAEEAAVALYQVQVLPEGEGELGEVFVRFRDPASGRMIEQSWTISYDPRAPAMDKASPSMQLAATSALLAEKLQGGPLADAIDMDALTPIIAQLRGQYSRQARVQDLVAMFEQTRRMTGRK